MTTSFDSKKRRPSSDKVHGFRRILPQVIATTIKNLHIIDLGLTVAIPTIVIPALTGIPNHQNRNEFLVMTGAQSSWIGSIGYFTQIFGSLASGLLTDRFGRKLAMILVNIPFIIGWLTLSQATQNWHVFVGFISLGLAVGLMESSVFTYLGEICEPSTRGLLIACTNIIGSFAILCVFVLNSWMPWRMVALFCAAVPIISAISLCFIPETPHWLLSKNRLNEAEKSLCWLRGWTKKEEIAYEFHELKRHCKRSNACSACLKENLNCSHPPPTLAEKFAEFKQKQTLKPFVIMVSLFFLMQFTGLSMRPFIVQIFKSYNSPIPSDQNIMILGLCENIANVVFMCLVRFTGKRRLYLTTCAGIFVSSFVVSCYGFIYLPSGYSSFDLQNQTIHVDNTNLAYIPTVGLYVWSFCSFCGFLAMPFMLLAELFPLKSRVLASGISASLNYVMGFIGKKTYYDLETTISMAGTSLLYCVITGAGLILMYFILPETEGRTLEDIELHFSDNSKTLCDRKIAKTRMDPNKVMENIS